MYKKYFISFTALIFLTVSLAFITNKIFAEATSGTENIEYPVKELGNCTDKKDCKSFCDNSANLKICLDFAKKNRLMSEEEIDTAEKFLNAGGKGPGGCKTKDACESYCEDIGNINECISFAEENDLIPADELEEAKKVQSAIAKGIKPPSCGSKKACDAYCDSPDNMEECITFGEAAGFIQGKDLEDAKKMLSAIKRGVTPPPCRGKEECDAYCSSPDNMEKCMTFALEAGFMNEEEKADSEKMLQALKKGIKPPNCRGKEECDAYCAQDEHFGECMNFAEAAGFMTAEEATMARKTGGKGPGGCKGKDECETFCNNPDNQETCFNFAKENGMIPEADIKQMEEGKQKFKEALDQAPSTVLECLDSQFGADMMEKFKSGAAMPPREIGDKMRDCFEKMGPPPGMGEPGAGGMTPPAGQTGPGGCKTPEECKSYCEEHPQDCQNFRPPANNSGPANPNIQGKPQPGQPGEEFQQIQPREEMQNGINPNLCQGENCQNAPPPGQYNPLPGQQYVPSSGQPGEQQFPEYQQAPMPMAPPVDQLPQQPPPSETVPPPPSSLLAPELFLGSVIDMFSKIFLLQR